MPSPFPGVDPYVETEHLWNDFRVRFIVYWRDTIFEQLRESYAALIDERFTIVDLPSAAEKAIRPDVAGASTPVVRRVKILEEERERFIQILRLPDRELVAILEFLSPSNKTNPGRGEYLVKRNAILRQRVHLVELDLLVEGERLPMIDPLPAGDYYAIVAPGDRSPEADVYAWTVRQPIPTIAIPLLPPDPDIKVDLAAVYARAYERARYDRVIGPRKTLELALSPDDRAWAEERARATAG
jgi:hypothetical protein